MPKKARGLEAKHEELKRIIGEIESAVVAFSGGVDSTFLLAAAREILAERILAVTAISEITPRHEREAAVQTAATLNVPHLMVDSQEMDIPEFVENPPERCYVCKKSRFRDLTDLAREKGFAFVLDGENVDDQADYRPGIRASRELGVRSPLREAGLTKSDIRALSRKLGLPTWNKPSSACLASRIPYGTAVTALKLRQIDEAEELLRSLLPRLQVRVRHHGDVARIESEPRAMTRIIRRKTRDLIVRRLKAIGFAYVTLDLEGYRTGSLNRSLSSARLSSPPHKLDDES